MTIERVSLRNFKRFAALDLPCAPLTLLTGHNAGGKSTALQALLLLAQGLRHAPDSDLLQLNGPFVDLGAGGDVVHHAASAQSLALGVARADERATWHFRVDKEIAARGLVRLDRVSHARDGRSSDLPARRLLPPELRDSPLVASLLATIFVGATREMQLEAYPVPRTSARARGDVGRCGEYAPYWYLEFADEEVDPARRRPGDDRETVRAQVDAWLDEFFPGARANAERLAVDAPVRLSFSLDPTSPWSKPANVGYGLSYAFPMIVALLTAARDATVVIDSAEAHLHPRAQSAVGRFLGRMAGAGLNILVESHSDHLLNGVRLTVRDGLLAPGAAAIHFFDGQARAPSVTSVAVDRNGAIADWPDGFFDQAERDLAVLSGWS